MRHLGRPGRLWWLLVLLSIPSPGLASTLKLQWDVPTLNTDGSPLTDLAGYRLTFCTGGTCDPTVGGTDISPDLGLVTTYLHTGLTPGTDYRYAIRAKDSSGLLSPFSYMAEGRAPPGDVLGWWFSNDSGASTTATDRSWNGFNGTLCEAAACSQQGPTWVTGRITTALHCDGVNDNVEVASSAVLDDTGDVSLTFWLRLLSTTNLTAGAVILTKAQPNSPFATPLTADVVTTATPHLRYFHFPVSGGATNALLEFTGYTVPLNTWVYVTMVRVTSSRQVTLYINGTSTQTLTYGTDNPGVSGVALRICTDAVRSSTRYANIDVDELRLYDYALSQTQITQLAIAPAAPGGPQLR